jgi:hypothetical protein
MTQAPRTAKSVLLLRRHGTQADAHDCEHRNDPHGNHQLLFGKKRKGNDYCQGDTTNRSG